MLESPLANWNGVEMPLDQARVSVLDRAFLFGDAVYEALRVYRGRPWLCDEHFRRLDRSLGELRIECDLGRLQQRMRQTIANSGVSEGLVYLQVTRGAAASRNHRFPTDPVTPNELIWVQEIGGDPHAHERASGVGVITHPDLRWGRRDIKSVNLLGNCLANQAAAEAGCAEAILVEADGSISEGSHTSLFGVKDGRLLTAPNSNQILPGITRGFVLTLVERIGVPLLEQAIRKENLDSIDELFLTGTGTEVLGIVTVDGNSVGSGKPGPVTERLYQAYVDAVQAWLAEEAAV